MVGGDAKKAKSLEKYNTPDAVANALLGLQSRIGSGEFKSNAPKPAGEGVAPEAVKAWKQERGLPTDVAEIKLPLPAGAKMDDLDDAGKARIGHFTKTFYDADVPQAAIDHIMNEYNAFAEKEASERAVADAKMRDELEDTLRADWGAEYRQNIASVDKFMNKMFGEEGADAIMGARALDGRRIFNMPGVFKALAQLARDNGIGDVETGEPSVGGKSVDQRLKEINDILSTDYPRYKREKLDEEKLALLQRKEAAASR